MNNPIPPPGPICRGSLSLGSGCGSCAKCRAERALMGGRFPYAETKPKPASPNVDAASLLLEQMVRHSRTERRERIAAAALQGLLANPAQANAWDNDSLSDEALTALTAQGALDYADALIAALDKQQRPFGWYRPRQGDDADQEPEFRTSPPPDGHGWLPVPAVAPAEWGG